MAKNYWHGHLVIKLKKRFKTLGGTVTLIGKGSVYVYHKSKRPKKPITQRFIFKCYCGNNFESTLSNVIRFHTNSCGCYNKKRMLDANVVHGMSDTELHKNWCKIFDRCYNHRCKSFKNYGGRGIKVSKQWHNFKNFYKDMHPRPSPRHSIDRINNNGNYSKGNCKWSTQKEQMKNMRLNKFYVFNGKKYLLNDLAATFDIPRSTLFNRLKKMKTKRAINYKRGKK